jgi:hypothetical protein
MEDRTGTFGGTASTSRSHILFKLPYDARVSEYKLGTRVPGCFWSSHFSSNRYLRNGVLPQA